MEKKIVEVRQAPPRHWVGDGFHVHSMFSYDDSAELLSPFLLLDYGAPAEFAPAKHPRGVGAHPHRGFETVTIAYQGEIEHRDSAGHRGRIGAGDVQWMTAASGVVHEEMQSQEFARQGGTMEMAQLWVNLPKKSKMSPPAYQDLRKENIPTVELPKGSVRVIAGQLEGVKGPARTFTPISLWDVTLEAGASAALPLRDGDRTAILVRHGSATVNGAAAGPKQLVVLDRRGDVVSLQAREKTGLLLMSGEPIDEPVAGYGPFVMNTREEIVQAVNDFQAGRLGAL